VASLGAGVLPHRDADLCGRCREPLLVRTIATVDASSRVVGSHHALTPDATRTTVQAQRWRRVRRLAAGAGEPLGQRYRFLG